MSDWRRICCAVDFSRTSRGALEEAAALARRLGAELLVLHVRPPSHGALATPFAPPERQQAHDPAEEDTLAAWTADALRIAPGLTTSVELSGPPAGEIVRFVREFACDLVVIGTHGRSGLGRLALGSVAEGVVRSAGCPVLVVRGPPETR